MDLPGGIFWGYEHSPKSTSPVATRQSNLELSSPLTHLAAETSVFHDLSLVDMDGIEFLPFDVMENELHSFGELGKKSTVSQEESGKKLKKFLEEDIDWQELLGSDLVIDNDKEAKINDLREEIICAEVFDAQKISGDKESAVQELMGDNEQYESLYSPTHKCVICSKTFMKQDELNTHYITCYKNLFAEENENNSGALNKEISIDFQYIMTADMSPENARQPIIMPSETENPNACTTDTVIADVEVDHKIDSQSSLLPELSEYIKTPLKESQVSKKAKRTQSHKILYACSICSEMFRNKHPLICHLRKHTTNCQQISHHMSTRSKTLKTRAVGQQLPPSQAASLPIEGSKHSIGSRSKSLKTRAVSQQLPPSQAATLPIEGSKYSIAKVRTFLCSFCNRQFSKSYVLKEHLRIHSGEKPYTCAICLFSCSQPTNLKRHVNSHAEFSKPFNCKNCNRKFATKDEIEKHLSSHNKKKAKLTTPALAESDSSISQTETAFEINDATTGGVAGSKTDRQETKTISITPLPLVKKSNSQSGEKAILTCSFCPKNFRFKSRLLLHIQSHSKKKSSIACAFCQATFMQAKGLKDHMVIHGTKMPFPCTDCKMGFFLLSALQSHIRRCHLAIYLCMYCGIIFRGISKLRVHELTHTKPYNCDICQFSCSKKINLKRHLDTHEQSLKPFTCTGCNRKFSTKDKVEKHLTVHTKNEAKIATLALIEDCLSTSQTEPTAEIDNGTIEKVAWR